MTVGFGVIRGTSTTFSDLRSSGNLSLIRQADLRTAIVGYYESWSFNGTRVAVRRSRWPNLLYQLIPPSAFDPDVSFDRPAETTAPIDRESVLAVLQTQQGLRELNWEMNYGRFFRGVALDLLEQARTLSMRLSGY